MEDLGLPDRFLTLDASGVELLLEGIDYDAVFEKREVWRGRFKGYLKDALKGFVPSEG